ncbi:AraC family transcriptional regulator [Stutzerimonas nosocomialis]|uniref:AraC family transcriptional regulator n=1 Tax=Stutzerimonas nosocomialis TaxID=1056496 RepID=UPI001108FFCA|nr:AraC family transcriptional regulator [Stutzerimonas nosocomialis]TLX56489.1 AraC family transcriptional regulator [Stutzerimonas nosocomialis]
MYRISTSFVAQLANSLASEGLDSARLCREAGIDLRTLGHPDRFVLRVDAYRLMSLAERESGNPDIGLRAYRHVLPGGFQLVGYTMMSSPNLRGALESLVRYAPLIGNGFTVGLAKEGECQRLWGLSDPADGPAPRTFQDAGLASMLGFCRWLTGGSLPRLREIEFTYPEPADTSEHQQVFGCLLRFGAARNSILFDQQALSHPLSTANEALSLLHGRFAEHRMGQLHEAGYSKRTRAWLIEHLSVGGCDMEAVALGLDVSKRVLQRGLAREGVTFRSVQDGARRQLADYYLRHHTYGLSRIGDLLGFKEPSSFHKACLRWFGMSPGRYRELCAGESPAMTG